MASFPVSQRGFTLYELLVVMAIIAIVGTIGTVSLLGFKQRVQVSGLANTIKADLNRAKTIAVRQKSSVVLQIHDDCYELFVDSGAGGATADDWIREGDEPRVTRRDYSSALSLSSNFPGDHLRLKSGGRIRPGTLTVANRSGTTVSVVVNAAGRIRLVYSA